MNKLLIFFSLLIIISSNNFRKLESSSDNLEICFPAKTPPRDSNEVDVVCYKNECQGVTGNTDTFINITVICNELSCNVKDNPNNDSNEEKCPIEDRCEGCTEIILTCYHGRCIGGPVQNNTNDNNNGQNNKDDNKSDNSNDGPDNKNKDDNKSDNINDNTENQNKDDNKSDSINDSTDNKNKDDNNNNNDKINDSTENQNKDDNQNDNVNDSTDNKNKDGNEKTDEIIENQNNTLIIINCLGKMCNKKEPKENDNEVTCEGKKCIIDITKKKPDDTTPNPQENNNENSNPDVNKDNGDEDDKDKKKKKIQKNILFIIVISWPIFICLNFILTFTCGFLSCAFCTCGIDCIVIVIFAIIFAPIYFIFILFGLCCCKNKKNFTYGNHNNNSNNKNNIPHNRRRHYSNDINNIMTEKEIINIQIDSPRNSITTNIEKPKEILKKVEEKKIIIQKHKKVSIIKEIKGKLYLVNEEEIKITFMLCNSLKNSSKSIYIYTFNIGQFTLLEEKFKEYKDLSFIKIILLNENCTNFYISDYIIINYIDSQISEESKNKYPKFKSNLNSNFYFTEEFTNKILEKYTKKALYLVCNEEYLRNKVEESSLNDKESEISDISKRSKRSNVPKAKSYKEIQVPVVDRNIVSNDYNICFIIDNTSSMSSWINIVKEICVELFSEIVKKFNKYHFSFGCVLYADKASTSYDENFAIDFTEDEKKFKAELEKIKEQSGGDVAEDWVSGYRIALDDLSWGNGTKLIFHFADAPAHGKIFNTDKKSDDFIDDENDIHGKNLIDLIKRCSDRNIKITGISINKVASFKVFQNEYMKVNGPKYEIIEVDGKELTSKGNNYMNKKIFEIIEKSINDNKAEEDKVI